jgi:hypothetical protein
MEGDLKHVNDSGTFDSSVEWPTLIHVTHWKAGSQWIHRILRGCAPDRVVDPEEDNAQFLKRPIRSAMIYPTVYLTKEEFDKIALPPFSRRFVVIRDLRDTLVSLYFSVKISHPDSGPEFGRIRSELRALGHERGLLWLLDTPEFHHLADIQQSWQQAGEPLIRFEELVERDEDLLENLLLHQCRLPVDRHMLREVVRASRFEALTGRRRGEEEIRSHYRSGLAGDWHNHFTERVTAAFKDRFGALLLATGYEQDLDWQARGRADNRYSSPQAADAPEQEHVHDLRSELEHRLALINRLDADLKRAQTDCNEKEREIVYLHGESEARLNLIKRLHADCHEKDTQIASLHNEAEARLDIIRRLDADLKRALARLRDIEK